tara:strand:+ start:28 stop:663 length:636 start_codon:yes stop_codon:yes gene_type:complete
LSYTVIENFLPRTIENILEETFQYNTEWNYVSETSGNEEEAIDAIDENVKECPQLIHISHWGGKDNPMTFGLTRMVLYFLEIATGCTVGDVHKIKTNMNIKDASYKGKYHPPHADHKSPEYFTLIYYIKDSDGPTRIFQKSSTDPLPYSGLKVVGEVHPKKGRAILLKSNLMHTGTCPTENENRLVINFVFKADNLKIDFDVPNTISVSHH